MESTVVFNPNSIELNAFRGDKPELLKRAIRGLRNVVPTITTDKFIAQNRAQESLDLFSADSENAGYWGKTRRNCVQQEPRMSEYCMWHQLLHNEGARRILVFGKAVEQEHGMILDRTQTTASGRSPIQVFAARGWRVQDPSFECKMFPQFGINLPLYENVRKVPRAFRYLVDLNCTNPKHISSVTNDWDVQYVRVLKQILPLVVNKPVGNSLSTGTPNFQDLDGWDNLGRMMYPGNAVSYFLFCFFRNTALHFCFHSDTFNKNLYNLLIKDWGADDRIPNDFGVSPRQLRNPDVQTPRVRVFRHYGASKTTEELEECLKNLVKTGEDRQ